MIRRITIAVMKEFGITEATLKARCRKRHITTPRFFAICLAKELTLVSRTRVAAALGVQDHTTVLNAQKRLPTLLKRNPELAERFERLRIQLLEEVLADEVRKD
jgi:chromosomal replication initiator protein